MPSSAYLPSVLVVVPTLGQRPQYLAQTLKSLALQRDVLLDIVVVAPPADTHARIQCEAQGITYLVQTGTGMSQAINQGWEARGRNSQLWAWLGDDDLLPPTSLARASAALAARPDASMVYGRCLYIDEEGRDLFEVRPGLAAARLLRWGPDLIPQPGSLARADCVRAVGLLDEALRFAMDVDLFLRLKDVGQIVYLPSRLGVFRWHDGSTTVSGAEASAAEARLVRRRTWTGRRRFGSAAEPLAVIAGRVLHKAQRRRAVRNY